MSAPRTTRRTAAAAATAATAAAVVLLGLGGSATADPPAVDFDPCVNTLERAGQWPGTLSDGYRVFSDGFDGYLGRQSACNPAP